MIGARDEVFILPIPNAAISLLQTRLVEAALHRFDVAVAVKMIVETLEFIGMQPLRMNLAVLSLHPSLAGVGFSWKRGARDIQRLERPWGFLEAPEHKGSPLQAVMNSRAHLRQRLYLGEGLKDFAILRDFAAQGATDYVAFPLFSPRPDIHVFTLCTDRPNGWSDEELILLESVMPILSLLIEVFEAHRLTSRERVDLLLLAHTDHLTKLLNRHGMFLKADNCFGPGRLCMAIYIDLDGVKAINDRLGHHFGDVMIQTAAQRILACLPPGAVAGRMGGDEFLVFTDMGQEKLPEKLRQSLSEVYKINSTSCYATASIGVALYDNVRMEELCRRSDLAMLESKKAGKNRVTYYSLVTDKRQERSAEIGRLLLKALQSGEFRFVIQPILSLKTGEIIHGECLARWDSPELGTVTPEDFVPIAEHSGDIALLERVMIDSVTQILAKQCSKEGKPVPLCINVSAKDIAMDSLAKNISEALSRHQLPANLLVIELTESVFINRYETAAAHFKQLRDLGLSLSLDDFGTGYSSLSYLQHFEFKYIKIDRSMVSALPSHRAKAIIKSILDLGRSLGTTIVAEGVETQLQKDLLSELGCEYAQGFLFARPMEVEAWEQWVHNDNWRRAMKIEPTELPLSESSDRF